MTLESVASLFDARSIDAASAETSPLEGFWASDAWVMRASPLGVGQGIYRFGGLTPQLTDELKLAVRAKLMAKSGVSGLGNRLWSIGSWFGLPRDTQRLHHCSIDHSRVG